MIRRNLLFISLAFSLVVDQGCLKVNSYLDKAETGGLSDQEVFGSYVYTSGFLSDIYSSALLSNWSPLAFGFNFSTICDEAHASHADTQGYGQAFKNGTLSPTLNPNDMWAPSYANLRKINIFLQKIDNVPPDKGLEDQERADMVRMKAEARFLRAWVYWELLKRYGGVPLLDHPLQITDNLQLPRNTYDEVVAFIQRDCDSAMQYLPLTYSSDNIGRATKGAAMLLKARVLLHAASPLNNPGMDQHKWQLAADASKAIMDLGVYSLDPNYKLLFHTRNSPEIILQSTSNFTDWLQRNLMPSLAGWGNIHPSQNLVDEYEMQSTGKMISEPGSGYDSTQPYAGRDPRFQMSIIYNGRTWGTKTIYTYVGGTVDGLAAGNNATRTGYYLAKTMDETGSLTPVKKPGNHFEIFMRYAEVLLNYAEAQNEAEDLPDQSVYDAINSIRQRPGVMMPTLPAGLTKDEMRTRIRHERMVEMAFENQRFWDVRRWKIAPDVLTQLWGMRITKSNGTYVYSRFLVENRMFRDANYLYPIPQTEINKDLALTQNPGY